MRIGDLITHVGATDVQFSSADVVQDLLDKVRASINQSIDRSPFLPVLLHKSCFML